MADDKRTDSHDESDDVVPVDPDQTPDDQDPGDQNSGDDTPAELTESEEIVDDAASSDEYVDDPDTPDINEAKLDRATDEVNAMEDEDDAPATGGTATRTRPRATQRPKRRVLEEGTDSSDSSDGLAKLDMTNLEPDADPPRVGPVTFTKQSVAELKKVKWASPSEVWQYFVVVLVFVGFIVAFVSLLDLGFGSAILRIFS